MFLIDVVMQLFICFSSFSLFLTYYIYTQRIINKYGIYYISNVMSAYSVLLNSIYIQKGSLFSDFNFRIGRE